MTSERSKRRDFLALVFISKSISKKLLMKIYLIYIHVQCTVLAGSLVLVSANWELITVMIPVVMSEKMACKRIKYIILYFTMRLNFLVII